MPQRADSNVSGCEGSKADVPRKPCCRRRGGGGGALVEPAALAALLYEDGYGYDMRRAILEHTNGSLDVDVGGMYRALRRLEEEGSVESRWGEDGSGPRRREYKVTDRGIAQAEQWLEALRQRRALDGIIIELLEEGLVHAHDARAADAHQDDPAPNEGDFENPHVQK